MKVAFLGLGVMGAPMAGHLARGGYDVTVYNRTASKAAAWAETHRGHTAATPADAARGAALVFMCLGNDDDVRSVVYGETGALAGLAKDTILVDHTTASADLARELAAAVVEKEAGFIDAPVSGGQAGAENGALTVMCGGTLEHFSKAEAALQWYSRSVRLMGPAGSGQLTKMVNQICIAGLVQGLSEGLHFAEQAGLDGAKVVDVISKGAAQSWQMDNRAKTMLEGKFDFGFAVDWMRKDLGICLAEARRCGAKLPVAALVDQFYAQVQSLRGGRVDTSSLIEVLRDK
ncbi:MAG: NAD(P)-dependent oxidoreductase [Rhodospirillaceae bacterium]|nr:NAD(P)-dependent oxidoreductase [Rhodospirillaceae bacterium]